MRISLFFLQVLLCDNALFEQVAVRASTTVSEKVLFWSVDFLIFLQGECYPAFNLHIFRILFSKWRSSFSPYYLHPGGHWFHCGLVSFACMYNSFIISGLHFYVGAQWQGRLNPYSQDKLSSSSVLTSVGSDIAMLGVFVYIQRHDAVFLGYIQLDGIQRLLRISLFSKEMHFTPSCFSRTETMTVHLQTHLYQYRAEFSAHCFAGQAPSCILSITRPLSAFRQGVFPRFHLSSPKNIS